MSPLETPPEQQLPLILTRLKELGEPIKRTGQISSLVNRFTDHDPALDFKIKQSFDHFRQFANESGVGQEARKELQNILTAYLFYQNRAVYQEEGKTHYNFKLEKREIEAVVAALEGKHVHMGTGEGKSSVVIPISAIVEAITSEKKSTIITTVSETLLAEIKSKTKSLLETLNFQRLNKVRLHHYKKTTEASDYINNDFFRKMEKEALLTGEYSTDTQKKITQGYWQHYLLEPNEDGLFPQGLSLQPTVHFATERDLVFFASSNRDEFRKNCPKILFDEADVAYNRGSPYVTVRKDRFLTTEEIKNSTYQWLFNYVVAKQLTQNDFESFQGKQVLKDRVIDKLSLQCNRSNSYFKQGIKIISAELGLTEQEAEQLAQHATNHFQEGLFDQKELKEYAKDVGYIMAQVTMMRNRQYLMKENGLPVVRDSYIDSLLEEHENQPEYQLAILALEDRFSLVPLNQAISSAVRFPTFINWTADQLVCFSGTLLYQGLRGKNLKKGSFAKLLEDITRRKVSLITPPERKTPPVPEFFETTNQAETACVKLIISQNKPILLIDHEGVDHTQKIFAQIKDQSDRMGQKKRAALLPPKPSNPIEEEKYNQYLDSITRELAEGRLDVIVSSGAAGVGVNIVRSDGSFPDLKVVHFGMPEHEALISQGDGRRRAAGDDFAWYLSREILNRFVSYFSEEELDKLSIAFGKVDQRKIKEATDEAMKDPGKRLVLLDELLKEKRRKEAQNDQVMVDYDQFFHKLVARFQAGLKTRLSQQFISKKTDLIQQFTEGIADKQMKKEAEKKAIEIFDKSISNLTAAVGIPQYLYYETLSHHPIVPGGGGPKSHIVNLSSLIFSSYNQNPSWFDQQVDEWHQTNQEKITVFDRLIAFGRSDTSSPFLFSAQEIDPKQIKFIEADEAVDLGFGRKPIIIESKVGPKIGFKDGEKIYILLKVLGANLAMLYPYQNGESYAVLPLEDEKNNYGLFVFKEYM